MRAGTLKLPDPSFDAIEDRLQPITVRLALGHSHAAVEFVFEPFAQARFVICSGDKLTERELRALALSGVRLPSYTAPAATATFWSIHVVLRVGSGGSR